MRSRRRDLQMFLVLGGLSAFAPLSIDMYLPALPTITRSFHTSPSAVQLTLTACLAGLAVGQLVAGPLSDAFGRRKPLLLGLGGYMVASVACAFAPSVYALIALRFLQGASGATGIVISRAVIRDLHSGARAARYFSRLMLITGVAPIVAPTIGSQILRFTSWRGVFVALALIGAVLLVVSLTGLRETLPVAERHPAELRATLRTFRVLLRDRVFLGYSLVLSCSLGALFAYISGAPFVLEVIHGVSAQTFSIIFGLNAVGLVAASQVNASLVGRVSPGRLLAASYAVAAGAGIALLAVTLRGGLGLAFTLVPFFLALGSAGFSMPTATALAMAEQGHAAGSASALLGVLQFAVGAAIAPLVGVAGTRSALPLALIMAGLGSVALGLLFVVRRAPRPARRVGAPEPGAAAP